MTVRTRFAPSPTGYLHVGGVRTALYSWLYARKHGGQFVLRIEDTDLERSTEASVNAILEGMAWLNLKEDEGPFFQTERFDRYRQVIQQLVDEGKAYPCYCSKERIEQVREEQKARKEKARYDGHCRHGHAEAPEGVNPVIRFKNRQVGDVIIRDKIKGNVAINNSELDDLIIARSDGTPTYNLTVVVDDWDMRITDVIRGDDHLNNTARQINILKALGADIPNYAHVPMILGDDGQRLSKRHGAVNVMQYKEEGFLPHALLNYLVRLGWSHGDQEVFSIDEMIEFFEITDVNGAPSAFNTEKLLWLNQHYIRQTPVEDVAKQLQYQFDHLGIDTVQGPALTDLIPVQADRCKTLKEMAEASRFFYIDSLEYDAKATKKNFKAAAVAPLTALAEKLEQLETWTPEAIHAVIHEVGEELELKLGKVAQPLRVAVTGGSVSPSIDQTVQLIGQTRTVERIRQALGMIAS